MPHSNDEATPIAQLIGPDGKSIVGLVYVWETSELAILWLNLKLVRHGITLEEFGDQAFVQPEEFHANQYTCIFHGVGMCDEAPKLYYPKDRAEKAYPAVLQENMVICMESYVGGVGERDGVKLEQQVLVTKEGYELLSTYPLEKALLD